MTDDDAHRVRLEGRLELLEVAQVRLHALNQLLGGFRWRLKLRRNTALLRETAASLPAVENALDLLEKRAEKEAWPERSHAVSLGREVESLWSQTQAKALRRLGRKEELTFQAALEQLELLVLTQPRLILPGQRWQAANELLPVSLAELGPIGQFGALLENLFKRPIQPLERLPFSAEEFEALREGWPEFDAALLAVWRRLAVLDSAGTLTRFLRRRARRAPMRRSQTGPEMLLAAEFWRSLSLARLKEVADARVAPLTCKEDELFPVVAWLLARQTDASAELSDPLVPEGRAGLLELAHELSVPPKKNDGTDRLWRRLERAAQRAEGVAHDDVDYARLRDNLSLFLEVLNRPETPPVFRAGPNRRRLEAPVRTGATLIELVAAMRRRVA